MCAEAGLRQMAAAVMAVATHPRRGAEDAAPVHLIACWQQSAARMLVCWNVHTHRHTHTHTPLPPLLLKSLTKGKADAPVHLITW